MKNTIISVLLVLSSSVFAGQVIEVPVEINFEARNAFGSMKTARFSDNEFEQIGCGTRTYGATEFGPGFSWGFCQARISEEESVICFAYDKPDLIQQINGVDSYSFVTFRWDENGDCTFVGGSTQSQYIPSKKDK